METISDLVEIEAVKINEKSKADKINYRDWGGRHILFKGKDEVLREGTVRIKKVKCNKPRCSKCPHSSYAYVQYRVGEKVTEKYLGIAR